MTAAERFDDEEARPGRVVPAAAACVEPLYRATRVLGKQSLAAESILAEARLEREEAREERRRILADVEAQAAAIRAEGVARGVREGAEDFLRKLHDLDRTIDRLEARFAIEVQRCALRFARAILDVELTVKPERIVDLVEKVLQNAKQYQTVVVHLHPDDVEIVRSHAARLRERLVFSHKLEFCADDALPRHGARVETEMGVYEGTIARQFEPLEDYLLRHERGAER